MPMPMFTLRPATWDDAPYVADLRRRTMNDVVCALKGAWDDTTEQADFEARFHPTGMYTVWVGGVRAGSVGLMAKPDHDYLQFFFLEPQMQGRGLGAAIFQHLLRRKARAALPLRLHASRTNTAVHRFYARFGFACVDRGALRWVFELPPRAQNLRRAA